MAGKRPSQFKTFRQGQSELLSEFTKRLCIDGKGVREAIEGKINPVTREPYSEKFKSLLEVRRKLPVYAHMDEFLDIFSENQIVIVQGETGSGKTTQIPQLVAFSNLSLAKNKLIACTQTRRVAAKSLARRVADEMDVQIGQHVGYTIRFEDVTEPRTTLLKYTTDGTLLQEAKSDPCLMKYSTIIIDEVHERTLATDLLLIILKGAVRKRPDLKIIVMSATPDPKKLRKYFQGCSAAVFMCPGRNYPVEIYYTQEPEPDYAEAAVRTVFMIHSAEDPGDILLFLTSEEEIEDVCHKIEVEAEARFDQNPLAWRPLRCIPLYSALSLEEQQRIFEPAPPPSVLNGLSGRKLIVSTNLAETSITIDGVAYVVDPGFFKCEVYNPRIRVSSQLVSPISKESARQRAGRAGRTRPGKCFRLFTERDFIKELEEHNHPAILRCSLSDTVLTLMSLGEKDLVSLDYLDVPAPESLMRALEQLNYLGALDDEGNITDLGRMMADLPLAPQLAKMLIASPSFKCSNEVLTIAAMLSVGKIWLRPREKQDDADKAKRMLSIPDSDHLTLLNVYNQYIKNKHVTDWTDKNYLSLRALQEAENVRAEIQQIMAHHNLELLTLSDEEKLHSNIRKALVCGFFMQIAHKENGKYITVKDNQIAALHPSCGLQTHPEWVLFNEFVLTTKPYIRTVSKVEVEWLLEFAPDYFDLHSFPGGATKQALKRCLDRIGSCG